MSERRACCVVLIGNCNHWELTLTWLLGSQLVAVAGRGLTAYPHWDAIHAIRIRVNFLRFTLSSPMGRHSIEGTIALP